LISGSRTRVCTGDGGEYRVRYSVDGGEAKYIDKWQPIWLSGWGDRKTFGQSRTRR
jgi:hypothetical protein